MENYDEKEILKILNGYIKGAAVYDTETVLEYALKGILYLYEKEKRKNERLVNADLTSVYMSGFFDAEKKWRNKINKEIDSYKKYDDGKNYENEISVLENTLKGERRC